MLVFHENINRRLSAFRLEHVTVTCGCQNVYDPSGCTSQTGTVL